jgi:hypothetical protein
MTPSVWQACLALRVLPDRSDLHLADFVVLTDVAVLADLADLAGFVSVSILVVLVVLVVLVLDTVLDMVWLVWNG